MVYGAEVLNVTAQGKDQYGEVQEFICNTMPLCPKEKLPTG